MSAVPPGYPPSPPGYPQWPDAYGVPPPPPGGRPTSRTTVVLIVALSVAGLLLLGTVAAALGYLYVRGSRPGAAVSSASQTPSAPPSPGVTATSELSADEGKVVYSDDFSGPNRGWYVGTYTSGTSFTYSSTGYVVVGKGFFTHFVDSPFSAHLAQIGMAVTGTQAVDAPPDAGFGVSCVARTGSITTRYAMTVDQSGTYSIYRFSPDTAGTAPDTLTSGRSNVQPGTTPITVVGMCATLSDQHTIRLALFAGNTPLADITDTLDSSVAGWGGALAFESAASHPSTDTITQFVERDLAR